MKKEVLVVGLTIAGLAAVPVVETLAEPIQGNAVTDTVTIAVDPACTFTVDEAQDGIYMATLGQGMVVRDIEGTKFKITCNGRDFDGQWNLTAKGTNEATMSDGRGGTITSTEGDLSGAVSNWQFKMDVTGAARIAEGYNEYKQIPAAETEVVSNTGSTLSVDADATIQAYYGVAADASQQEGTYTGNVVYTLVSTPND